jgi:glycerophosphoryl diester phosphodiesterase
MSSQPDPEHGFFKNSHHNVDVIAHRGGNGQWPGETLFAFAEAKKLGVDVLEMDIRVTRDGQLVMMHNPTVRTTTKGWLPVRCYTLAEIQKLNAGYDWREEETGVRAFRDSQDPDLRVPSFEQVLKRFGDMRMNIEIKGWHPLRNKAIAQEFCRLIDKYDMRNRILVASFHQGVLRVIREQLPGVAISASTVQVARFVVSSRWGLRRYKPNVAVIQTCSRSINARVVDSARKHGLKLHGWTVDDTNEMDRLIDLGVDGIITNFPSRLLNRPGLKTLKP